MLDAETRFHAERCALFDREGRFGQVVQRARFRDVDDDVVAALDFEAEREDYNGAWVFGVANCVACAEAEGCFPFPKRLVVCICGDGLGLCGYIMCN